MGAVNYRSMSNMRAFFQYDSYSGEHMNGAVLLNIATILDDNFSPVPPNCSSWSDVYILADYYIARDGGIWMNKCALMDDWFKALKFENIIAIVAHA